LIATIASVVVVLLLIIAGALLYRFLAKKRRQGKVLRWSRQRGFVLGTMDFECVGNLNGDDRSVMAEYGKERERGGGSAV